MARRDLEMSIESNIDDVVRAMGRAPREVLPAVDQALSRGAMDLARAAARGAPKDTSELTRDIRARRVGLLEHMVGTRKAHGVHQERGTGPGGRPAMQTILDWMRRKSITPRTPGMSQRQLGALIRKRIAERGLPAQPFMRPALVEMQPRIARLLRDSARAALRRVAEGARA